MLNFKFISYFDYFFNKNIYFKKNKNNIIIAKILQIKNNFVTVDSNLKSESNILFSEFVNNDGNIEVKTGDYIELFLECLDDGKGNTILSRFKFKDFFIWRYFKKIFLKKQFVIGYIFCKIKGGLSVIIRNIKCFLPFSNIDKKVLFNITYYENKFLNFRIINVDKKKKNIILSRKLVVNKILNNMKFHFINSIKIGSIVLGIVKNITNYGIFIDLGYMDGLVLNCNLGWGPYKYSNEILYVNQTIKVRVLKINKSKNRILLGIKQLIKNPWINIYNKYQVGCKKFAKVYCITNNRIYFILEKGVFGFIKKKKVSNSFFKKIFIDNIKINTYIKVKILYINSIKHIMMFDVF